MVRVTASVIFVAKSVTGARCTAKIGQVAGLSSSDDTRFAMLLPRLNRHLRPETGMINQVVNQDQSEPLLRWAIANLGLNPDITHRLEPVSGDASFRRYFRLKTADSSVIVVDAPPAHEKNPEFVAVTSILTSAGVRVPQIFAVDLEHGWLLLEDFGNCLLLPELTRSSAGSWYRQAIEVLLKIQQAPVHEDAGGQEWRLPLYSDTLFQEEMDLFPQWFLSGLLDRTQGEQEQRMIADVCNRLVHSATEQPRVMVHRDFHSRNLMVLSGSELGVIDYQDAVAGPLSYDLVSLLRDCYIQWSPEYLDDWLDYYLSAASRLGVLEGVDSKTFRRWFDLMGMQRHIKVLGIFARLYLRDGKSGYLKDLPLVLEYTIQVSARYPEFDDFSDWLSSEIVPLVEPQGWYQRPELPA